MQQKWWLIAAGVIGIGLAVLLFPRPDTGGETPTADPANRNPLDFKSERPRVVTRPDGPGPVGKLEPRKGPRELRSPEERIGPNPIAADLAKARSTPEAIHAGRASGPWTVVRRQLVLMADDESAKAIADEISPLILELRTLRRDPEGGDYAKLEQQQNEMLARIRANDAWLADEVIVASLDRLDGILAEYHKAVAAGDAQPAGEDAQE